MLIFVYFIIIFFFLPGGVQGGVGFDVVTGEVCVLDPRDICCGCQGLGGGG